MIYLELIIIMFCSLCYSDEFTLFDVTFHLPFVCPVLKLYDVLL